MLSTQDPKWGLKSPSDHLRHRSGGTVDQNQINSSRNVVAVSLFDHSHTRKSPRCERHCCLEQSNKESALNGLILDPQLVLRVDALKESMVRICPECNAELEAEVCPKDGRRTVDAAVFKREQTDPYLEVTVDGKYRIETRLGQGGFGAVYRAQHVDTGGDVAIKILKRELADDETVVKRFYLEAQNTHKLHHPNTVRLNDFGHMEGGALYTVMEYVRGRTLASVLDQEGALPPRALCAHHLAGA